MQEVINIIQLPAIRVGRFGYSSNVLSNNTDSIYDADLYMEQRYEFSTMPAYLNTGASYTPPTPINSVFHGRRTALSVFDFSQYNAPNYFNYQSTLYQAINYCAYKNRDENKNGTLDSDEIKWYLPSQAQLMGMWVAHNLPSDTIENSNFVITTTNNNHTEPYWSSTWNNLYTNEAQYLNFIYGNVGHNMSINKSWTRCVRDGRAKTSMVQSGSIIDFGIDNGSSMPASTYTITSKNSATIGDETGSKNATLYKKLQVGDSDIVSLGTSVDWNDAVTLLCPGGAGNWRLPTQRELQAIWILQFELKKENSSFNLLGDDYYWSQTEASAYPNNTWVVYGGGVAPAAGDAGNAPHRLKTERSRVRCVRETP